MDLLGHRNDVPANRLKARRARGQSDLLEAVLLDSDFFESFESFEPDPDEAELEEPESDDEPELESEEPSLLWPSELSRWRLRVP